MRSVRRGSCAQSRSADLPRLRITPVPPPTGPPLRMPGRCPERSPTSACSLRPASWSSPSVRRGSVRRRGLPPLSPTLGTLRRPHLPYGHARRAGKAGRPGFIGTPVKRKPRPHGRGKHQILERRGWCTSCTQTLIV